MIWSSKSLDRIAWFFTYPCVLTTINNILQDVVGICKHRVRCGHKWTDTQNICNQGQAWSITHRNNPHAHEREREHTCSGVHTRTGMHTQRQKSLNTDTSHYEIILCGKGQYHSAICLFRSYYMQRKSYFTPQSSQLWGLASLLPASPCYLVPIQNLQFRISSWIRITILPLTQTQVIKKRLFTKLCNCHPGPLSWGWYKSDRAHSGVGISAGQLWSWGHEVGLGGVWCWEAGQFSSSSWIVYILWLQCLVWSIVKSQIT